MTDPRETEPTLDPKYDAAGLITAVVTDRSGALLMVAHMNAEALAATQATGEAHFFSRSRQRLWKKGETSGERAARRRFAHRLRSGRAVGHRRSRRSRLPHRTAKLLLPPRRGRAAGPDRVKRTLLLPLLLAGCGDDPATPANDTAGARLETAATEAGLVVDPAKISLIGAWARDTDRVCVVPGEGDALRIGARVDYGEGQGCAASGTATRSGDRIRVTFGACRFEARLDGDRIVFPAEVPGDCDRLCAGRASLAALAVDHLSASLSEAATLRAPNGDTLCPG